MILFISREFLAVLMIISCALTEAPHEIKLTSASLTSVYENGFGKYAIDGVIPGHIAHSMCTLKGPQSLTINFESRSCVKDVVVYQSHLNEYRYRMDGAEVSVLDKAGSPKLCGAIKINDVLTAEGQTYTIDCDRACGDGIVVSVNTKDDSKVCIHLYQVTATGYTEAPHEIKLTSASLTSVYEKDFGKYAIDGVIPGHIAHSMCTLEGRQALTINFESRSCVKDVVVYQSKLNEYRYRMDGAEVSVLDKAGSPKLCGAIKINDVLTAEGQTYTIDCDQACGDGIVVSVNRKDNLQSCIHLYQVTATGYTVVGGVWDE